jgi:hypothetical protein
MKKFISGCNSQKESLDNLFNEKHKSNSEALFTHYLNNGAILFYSSTFDNGLVGIGAAVFERIKTNWKMLSSSVGYYPTEISLDIAHLPANEPERDVQYGVINNNEIIRVELVDSEGNTERATIVDTKWKRIWYIIGNYKEASLNAYSKNGDIIVQIPEIDLIRIRRKTHN